MTNKLILLSFKERWTRSEIWWTSSEFLVTRDFRCRQRLLTRLMIKEAACFQSSPRLNTRDLVDKASVRPPSMRKTANRLPHSWGCNRLAILNWKVWPLRIWLLKTGSPICRCLSLWSQWCPVAIRQAGEVLGLMSLATQPVSCSSTLSSWRTTGSWPTFWQSTSQPKTIIRWPPSSVIMRTSLVSRFLLKNKTLEATERIQSVVKTLKQDLLHSNKVS